MVGVERDDAYRDMGLRGSIKDMHQLPARHSGGRRPDTQRGLVDHGLVRERVAARQYVPAAAAEAHAHGHFFR